MVVGNPLKFYRNHCSNNIYELLLYGTTELVFLPPYSIFLFLYGNYYFLYYPSFNLLKRREIVNKTFLSDPHFSTPRGFLLFTFSAPISTFCPVLYAYFPSFLKYLRYSHLQVHTHLCVLIFIYPGSPCLMTNPQALWTSYDILKFHPFLFKCLQYFYCIGCRISYSKRTDAHTFVSFLIGAPYIFWMKFILHGGLVVMGYSTHVRSYNTGSLHEWQLKTVTNECCESKGGNLCGTIVTDCCKKGCQSGYFDTQWCEDDLSFNPTDCDSCSNICRNKGGIVCATQILIGTKIQCCSQKNCEGSVVKSCKEGTIIDLGKCSKDSFLELIKQTRF